MENLENKSGQNFEVTSLNEDNITHELEKGKSADVFNALNLYSESLGELYEKEGYNPFEKNFVLNSEFADNILKIKGKNKDISPESFLDSNNKNIAKNFDIALSNNTKLLDKMQNKLSQITNVKVKKQVQNMIITLKNRGELLRISKDKLKKKDADALKMYIEIFGLDSELSELLGDNFTNKINIIIVLQHLLDLCQTRAMSQNYAKNTTQEKSQNINKENVIQQEQNIAPKVEKESSQQVVQENVENVQKTENINQEKIENSQDFSM